MEGRRRADDRDRFQHVRCLVREPHYRNAKDEHVEVQITGDSAMVAQLAPIMANPQIAGVLGKIVRVGSQRAIQTPQGDVQMIVANKFLVMVTGSAPADAKSAYAVDVTKLSKM